MNCNQKFKTVLLNHFLDQMLSQIDSKIISADYCIFEDTLENSKTFNSNDGASLGLNSLTEKITKPIQQIFVIFKLQPGPWIIMQIGYTETFLVRNWILCNRPTLKPGEVLNCNVGNCNCNALLEDFGEVLNRGQLSSCNVGNCKNALLEQADSSIRLTC